MTAASDALELAHRVLANRSPFPRYPDEKTLAHALIAATAELERIARVHAGHVEYGSAEHQEMYTPLAQRLMGERDTAVRERDAARGAITAMDIVLTGCRDELATANAERARLDHLSRCSTIGCGSGGRCDHVGTEQYPCPIASGKAVVAERDALLVRRDELLVTIRKLSREVPYEEEARSTATLIAEVGTLRSALTAERATSEELRKRIPTVDVMAVVDASVAMRAAELQTPPGETIAELEVSAGIAAHHTHAALTRWRGAVDALTPKEPDHG